MRLVTQVTVQFVDGPATGTTSGWKKEEVLDVRARPPAPTRTLHSGMRCQYRCSGLAMRCLGATCSPAWLLVLVLQPPVWLSLHTGGSS